MPKVIKTPISQFLKFKQKEIAGTQDKWEKDGIYYKTDTTPETAEGLAECIASDILSKSNIKDFYLFEIIRLYTQQYLCLSLSNGYTQMISS